MAIWKYKTRGDSSPQGKRKIYFSAHPKNFDEFFEKVVTDILDALEANNNTNCAIWYLEDPNSERDEDFLLQLREMQLFVFPITSAFLSEDNASYNIDFKYAYKKHIPILPIIQESRLAKLFNKKCGKIQFLNPKQHDPTEIKYEIKLKKFLSSIFINDNLTKQIRSSFDTCIFLSYRKKDRIFAQKLINAIHEIDFCRDISIWYDEFLIPGENFNKAIKRALNKSKLFILVVTPSILEKNINSKGDEEDNYILKTEYPMACKKHMKILPVELTPTDKDELASKYGITSCISVDNCDLLKSQLQQMLHGIINIQNDDSSEHSYLIALAYLLGIDVEIDYKLAISLLKSAAKHNHIGAIRKLVEIYSFGEGINKDLSKAIEWHEKLINILRKEYLSTPTTDTTTEFFDALSNCGEMYVNIKQYEPAQKHFSEALKIITEHPDSFDDYDDELATAHLNLAYSYKYNFKLFKARKHFLAAIGLLKKIHKREKTEDSMTSLCNAYYGYSYARWHYIIILLIISVKLSVNDEKYKPYVKKFAYMICASFCIIILLISLSITIIAFLKSRSIL